MDHPNAGVCCRPLGTNTGMFMNLSAFLTRLWLMASATRSQLPQMMAYVATKPIPTLSTPRVRPIMLDCKVDAGPDPLQARGLP